MIKNYYEGDYYSTQVLCLTQIEGLLWDLSIILHNWDVEKIYDSGKIDFFNYEEQHLVNEKGEMIYGKPSIGSLLKNTKIKNYIENEFIEYCTDELYRERNPILHGRNTYIPKIEDLNKKIMTLEMIIYKISNYMIQFCDIIIRKSLKENYEEYLNLIDKGDTKKVIDYFINRTRVNVD